MRAWLTAVVRRVFRRPVGAVPCCTCLPSSQLTTRQRLFFRRGHLLVLRRAPRAARPRSAPAHHVARPSRPVDRLYSVRRARPTARRLSQKHQRELLEETLSLAGLELAVLADVELGEDVVETASRPLVLEHAVANLRIVAPAPKSDAKLPEQSPAIVRRVVKNLD